MNKKNSIFNLILKNGLFLYCLLVALCAIGVCFYNIFVGLVLLSVSVATFVLKLKEEKNAVDATIKYYSSMAEVNDKFDITKGVTIAMVSVGTDGKINWWNEAFGEICPSVTMHDGITEHIPSVTMDLLSRMGSGEECRVDHGEKCYQLTNVPFKADNVTDSAFVVTLKDITELEYYKKEARDIRTVIMHVLIDNYDELLSEEGDDVSYQAEKEIETLIFEWVKSFGGSVRHIEKGRYMCLFNSEMLERIKTDKFDILEKAKLRGAGSAIEPTLSIGVGIGGEDINEIDVFAKTALDMALGRGGDQAVIKDGSSFTYFGGKNRETEKRTKVKARVKALAMLGLIEECDNVIVMGHVNADADSFGASVALACIAMAHGKPAKVLLEGCDSTVISLMRSFENNQTHSGLFINKMQARELIRPKTLVVVCDTHRRSLVASAEILDEAYSVVLIDHHRRSEEFISNTDLLYHEPFASSSCEMVAEMLQYIGRGGINAEIAEAMYAGILIDTNNFIYKTGVRTLEAAAYLKRLGADTLRVRKSFRESYEAYRQRSEIVCAMEMYKESVGISKVYSDSVRQDVIAKAANDILEIENVVASFVIAPVSENVISVSCRSYGDINVQLIAEKLGGGGHMLAGAAQLEDTDVDTAEKMLKEAIDEILSEK
ncbi:MAG: DHH family phosphoesterase [Clostridia bacterium]|nr:DHH family phosphoesterase [Clostridia bacterium]